MKNNHLIVFIAAFTGLAIGLSIWTYKWSQGHFELTATQSSKAKRSTELGVAVPKKKYQQKETLILNDPALSQKWGLDQTKAIKAWKRLRTMGEGVTIAVIDTGIDVHHPDIQNSLWVNTGEVGYDKKGNNKATNGIDDDKNGCVDDIHGCNFTMTTDRGKFIGDVTDNHGHGTHIAGIIAAERGNGIGVAGVAPKSKIMVLKYYDPKAPGINNLQKTILAMKYAIRMGAQIINYSGGGLEPSSEEKEIIRQAQKKGILVIAAAGNEKSNSDIKPYYPADYDLPNIISVTAIDKQRNVLPTSNFGVRTVDLAAPGNNIFSTLPLNKGKFGFMTGTSQATAFVTGVAALIMSHNTEFAPGHIKNYLTKTGDLDSKLDGKTRYKKRLNTYKALTVLDQGVGLTGVIATNSVNMKSREFASDPTEKRRKFESDIGHTNLFVLSGKAIVEKAGKGKKEPPQIRPKLKRPKPRL